MKIIAIGAHPDDLEYGCGGTLIKMAKKKFDINLMIMTRGEMGGNPDIRQREQEQVAKKLHANLFWGRFNDTQIPLEKQTINTIEYFIKRLKPDLIFCLHPQDTHQDHRTVAQATITATRYVKNVLFYEVPTSTDFRPASIFSDLTGVINQKVELLKLHKSQVFSTRIADLSILEAAKSTAQFRGMQNRVRYAEAFVPLRISLDTLRPF
jgi:LmbE family N-acetylglucosaminyl deacetylase